MIVKSARKRLNIPIDIVLPDKNGLLFHLKQQDHIKESYLTTLHPLVLALLTVLEFSISCGTFSPPRSYDKSIIVLSIHTSSMLSLLGGVHIRPTSTNYK